MFPFQEVYMSVALWLPKLYANAMIMVINARFRVVYANGDDHIHIITTRSGVRFRGMTSSPETVIDTRFLQQHSPVETDGTATKDRSLYSSDTMEMKKVVSVSYGHLYWLLKLVLGRSRGRKCHVDVQALLLVMLLLDREYNLRAQNSRSAIIELSFLS